MEQSYPAERSARDGGDDMRQHTIILGLLTACVDFSPCVTVQLVKVTTFDALSALK
jgi:hypothetical protein